MRKSLFIARWDLRHQLRQKETLLWVFLMPIVFFFFIGEVTGGMGGGGSGARRDTMVVERGADAGFLADEIERRLGEQGFDVEPAAPEAAGSTEDAGTAPAPEPPPRLLRIPADFTGAVQRGEGATVVFEREPGGMSVQFDELRAARATYTVLADLVVLSEDGEPATPEGFARLAEMPRALTLSVRPAGKREQIPTGYQQTIPGTMVMFTMIVLLTSGAVLVVIERRSGLLRRIAATPITRAELVLGKWIGMLALGLVQVGFGMVAGVLLFGMDWGPDLAMVLAVLAAWAMLVASMSLLVGSISKSEGQAVAIGVLSSNVLAALGGCWWPIEITPGWMQDLALFLPTGWAMDALHSLVVFEHGAASALPHVAGMLVAALAVGALAVRTFRYE